MEMGFTFRPDKELLEKIETSATANRRSLSNETAFRVASTFENGKPEFISKFDADKCKIIRGGNIDFPNSVEALNQKGERVIVVDQSWSDEHILLALKLAHRSHEIGVAHGRKAKANEIIKSISST